VLRLGLCPLERVLGSGPLTISVSALWMCANTSDARGALKVVMRSADRVRNRKRPAAAANPWRAGAGTKVPSHYCFSKQWRKIMIFKCLAIAFLATAVRDRRGVGANSHKPSGYDYQCYNAQGG
jgi:hypothetical protein